MKPKVDFIIPCENEEGAMVLHFYKIEEIESVIDSLEECRAELEHQIEMERQRKRDKRKRAKMSRKLDNKKIEDALNKLVSEMDDFQKKSIDEQIDIILKDYNSLGKSEKELLKPLIDNVKRIKKDRIFSSI